MQGRVLTVAAMYYRYTGDGAPLVQHIGRLDGIARMLAKRRDDALRTFPNASDPRHGMPSGNDEADEWWATSGGGHTEQAFISIAAEAWRGLRDCGDALADIAERAALPPTAAPAVRQAAQRMSALAKALLPTLQASMGLSAFVDGARTCHPYAAGFATCGMLPSAVVGTSRASEAWRTYPEALYSGALGVNTTRDIFAWHLTARAATGSRMKLGTLLLGAPPASRLTAPHRQPVVVI